MSPGSSYSRLPTPRVARGGALLLVLMIGAALAFLPVAVAQEGSSQGSSGAHKDSGPPPNHSTDTSYGTFNRETPGACPGRPSSSRTYNSDYLHGC